MKNSFRNSLKSAPPDHGRTNPRVEFFICLVISLLVMAVYSQSSGHGFLIWDDPLYVTENRHVRSGLNPSSMAWALSTVHAANWHPLTWLSHMADVSLFGLNPGAHHMSNVLLHLVNSLLVFAVFRSMTGAVWQSALVGALFAIHPLHVESVAWIAERKDLLSTFFWLLAMLAYHWYVRRPGIRRYLLVAFAFACGLMSKPMVVTLPLVLLLLDFWPLGRFAGTPVLGQTVTVDSRWLVAEKLPLLAMSAASSVITVMAQARGDAVAPLEMVSFTARLANAVVSYLKYAWLTLWPHPLLAWYQHPGMPPASLIALACLFLVAGGLFSILLARRHPWFTVGWLWWLGTLVPVIGIVQVGSQAMADRYMYIPMTGLLIIIAWGGHAMAAGYRWCRLAVVAMAVTAVAVFTMVSHRQVGYWGDTVTLFSHTLKYSDNGKVHFLLGQGLAEKGNASAAHDHYLQALAKGLDDPNLHNNLGVVLNQMGRTQDAVAQFHTAIRKDPGQKKAYNNLGNIMFGERNLGDAADLYRAALSVDSCFAEAHNNLGAVFAMSGDGDGAKRHFRQALICRPEYASARWNLEKVISNEARQ
jgi:Tfp pilus assembly protein PilF